MREKKMLSPKIHLSHILQSPSVAAGARVLSALSYQTVLAECGWLNKYDNTVK